MAGTKNIALTERNRRIVLLRRNGFTYAEIAQMEGISRVRVAQIFAEHNAELGEDEGRAEIAGLLEFAERKAVELINEPGFMMAPNGRAATDGDGEPIPNKTLINEALKTLLLVADRKSRLYAWDKPAQQNVRHTHEVAVQQSAAAILAEKAKAEQARLDHAERQELEMLRRRAAVIPGTAEVVRELPAAGA